MNGLFGQHNINQILKYIKYFLDLPVVKNIGFTAEVRKNTDKMYSKNGYNNSLQSSSRRINQMDSFKKKTNETCSYFKKRTFS